MRDEEAMTRVLRAFERAELHNVHWSRLTPEYQLAQVASAFWSLTKGSGKTQAEALKILSESSGRLYNPQAVSALERMCERGILRTATGSYPRADNGNTHHSLQAWHARLEEFEREHPESEAFFRFLFRCSLLGAVVLFGWYGVGIAKYLSRLVGFPALFVAFLAVYAIERVAELVYFQRRRIRGRVYDGWSLYLLSASHVGVVCLAAAEALGTGRSILMSAAILGYVGFIGSVALRWWTIATLDPYESAHIEIREPHPLIASGPYRYLRHPRYFANMIEVASIPLMGNAWFSLLLALLTYVPFTWVRLVREEKIMREKLGPVYESYLERVKRWPSWKLRG